MSTFKEANQSRTSLKMLFSQYSWYQGSSIVPDKGDYCIIISVSRFDDNIRKIIPFIHQGILLKIEVENSR